MSHSFLYGFHAVTQKLKLSPGHAMKLYCVKNQNPRLTKAIHLAQKSNISIEYCDKKRLSEFVDSDKHQGCVLQVKQSEVQASSLEELLQVRESNDLYLILDGVQDPHNLGACLRTADAAGVKAVVVPRDRATGVTAVVQKVAAGAAETVPVITVTNLVRSIERLKESGIWVVGTTGEATESLYNADLAGPIALVMGAEGEGMRRLTAESCDFLVKLPMLGQVESLNVSVATGICLYEIVRTRQVKI